MEIGDAPGELTAAFALTDEEIEEGYVLACCSHPIGTVEIAV